MEYKPLLDGAKKIAKHKIEKTVIFQRDNTKANLDGDDVDQEFIVHMLKVEIALNGDKRSSIIIITILNPKTTNCTL